MKIKNQLLLAAILVLASVGVKAQEEDREAFHQAMEACISETGVSKPEPGTRPSEEDHAKIKACLESKGIQPPQGGPRGGRRGGKGGARSI